MTAVIDSPAPASTARTEPGYAWPVALAGSALLVVSGLLPWTFRSDVLGNVALTANPGPMQIFVLVLAVLAIVLLLARRGILPRVDAWSDTAGALRAVGAGAATLTVLGVLGISWQLGGLANVDPGAWLGLVGAALLTAAAFRMTHREHRDLSAPRPAPGSRSSPSSCCLPPCCSARHTRWARRMPPPSSACWSSSSPRSLR